MATQSVSITAGVALPNNAFGHSGAHNGDVGASLAAVTSAMATLVADGASPTQAHVTAVNNAYTTLKNQLAGHFTVIVDTANITSKNSLLAAWTQALLLISGSGTAASK